MALLIIFGGLPGAGKTSIAKALAAQTAAMLLRVDTIEQTIRTSGLMRPEDDMGPAGYDIACRVAAENLSLGKTVIVDSVNPIAITRQAYREVATQCEAPLLEVEILCSDREEHRHRVEMRTTDVDGLTLPSWQQVLDREYEPWDGPVLRLDTAELTVEECVERIRERMDTP